MNKVISNRFSIFILVFPATLIFTIFVITPLFINIFLSLFNYDGVNSLKFAGFGNYTKIFSDTDFWDANKRSLFLSLLAVIFDTLLGTIVAIILIKINDKLQKIYRTSMLMPMVLSIVVISQLWLMIYDADYGLLNKILNGLGLSLFAKSWLIDTKTSLVCVAIVGMWQYFGYSVLLIFAGLKSIPAQYYEASTIDGANFFKATVRITIPLLAEAIKSSSILFAAGGLYTFSQIYVMTSGGPGKTTETMVYYVYEKVFSLQQFGTGTAAAVFAIIESIIIILAIQLLVAREKYYY